MMKGALVELIPAISISLPNVVIFQFNPETLRHTWSQPVAAPAAGGQLGSHPLAVSGEPEEAFSLSLSMDVTDQLSDADPMVAQEATDHGIYARLATLELLMWPSITFERTTADPPPVPPAAPEGESRPTPAAQLPTVLFVWGTGRIVPVRVTSLRITEKLYDVKLNPTHADAELELRVLMPNELKLITGLPGEIARSAYDYSRLFRLARAASGLAESTKAAIGMLGDTVFKGPDVPPR